MATAVRPAAPVSRGDNAVGADGIIGLPGDGGHLAGLACDGVSAPRAAASSTAGRPRWAAGIPPAPPAAVPWPKPLVPGDRAGAPARYRECAGEPLLATVELLAGALGADPLVAPGRHPHTRPPAVVGATLRGLWVRVAERAGCGAGGAVLRPAESGTAAGRCPWCDRCTGR
ncbi:hypothetical protein [Streptomyces sp. x-80]|uniref:hypothetical protein n=1 Tax=Streptomyces sp. x-80 TaxID=2789282 RepID=UPI003980788A